MTRDAASEGVALGAVSLPWALAGALAWALAQDLRARRVIPKDHEL